MDCIILAPNLIERQVSPPPSSLLLELLRLSLLPGYCQGIRLLVAILQTLYRHLIQPCAGALHKKTLLRHISKIDVHMLRRAPQVFSAVFQRVFQKRANIR